MLQLVITHEPLALCYESFDEMAKDYYRTTEASLGVPPLDFNWPHFLTLERTGHILCMTCREGGLLIGIVFYIVQMHPQHQTWKIALCNTLAVAPKFRGKGIGRRLMECAEPLLRLQGVKRIIHGFRMDAYGTIPTLFDKSGYSISEVAYKKDL